MSENMNLDTVLDFAISAFDGNLNAENLVKLALPDLDRDNILNLVKNISGTESLGELYTLVFPDGISETLSRLSLSSADLGSLVAMSSIFTALAAVTQQCYLQAIDRKLDLVNRKIDHILEFLYGDKKAELLAEISFSKYAYDNFSTMVRHSEQRTATINSLHDGKKIAIKDIEFYIADLSSSVYSDFKLPGELEKNADKALKICDTIDTSIQLYTLNCLLEVYYSQNTNEAYIAYLENSISDYVEKCDKRILEYLATLRGKLAGNKMSIPALPNMKNNRGKILNELNTHIEALSNRKIGDKQKELLNDLHAVTNKTEYVITSKGDVYLKAEQNRGRRS